MLSIKLVLREDISPLERFKFQKTLYKKGFSVHTVNVYTNEYRECEEILLLRVLPVRPVGRTEAVYNGSEFVPSMAWLNKVLNSGMIKEFTIQGRDGN